MLRVILISIIVLLTGCASSPHKTNWGGSIHLTPTWEKFKHASVRALKDPGTWIPAAGAAVALASGKDEEWTQAALRDNWVYGSKHDAAMTSDNALNVLTDAWIASTLITNGSISSKAKGILGEVVIIDTSNWVTNELKVAIRRREPDRTIRHVEYEAFPSGHSTPAFTRAALIRRNLEYSNMNDVAKYSTIAGSYYLAAVSSYGRIESGLHHFSDQFAGAALGNFIGLVMYDTFFEPESKWFMTIQPTLEDKGATVNFHVSL